MRRAPGTRTGSARRLAPHDPRQSHPVSLFEHRAFVRFWTARLAGTAAQQMLMLAIGWQMYQLTGSAWDLGLVGLAQFAPSLAVALVAGHAADRYDRVKLVILCLAVQGVIAMVLLLAAH